ncbi:4'-phosphopantetheinyl transferase superfamily protein [Streptomyces sp. AJS327]|uniref:4'-phosphopantetheinyl transferase family protein n=1 Tax=Streptomyces sp. AJS327 TaxID=2545265 RepID=UPI0015DDEE1C|nr:4'-phosphopantetheinyl transferase superfamily protein [Streptomyces sp. AJS327]MBA0052707.1 4'-phosphopantetheinyl transferase superfamily protein [Streptomyces sp. AJS327]
MTTRGGRAAEATAGEATEPTVAEAAGPVARADREEEAGAVEVHLLDWADVPWSSVAEVPGLPADDLAHATAYSGARRQLQAALARTVLRAVLARALDVQPGAVPLVRGADGRTRYAAARCPRGGPPPAFGVSHDGVGLAVAFRAGREDTPDDCGVDVEDGPVTDFVDVAPRFCAPGELGGPGWAVPGDVRHVTPGDRRDGPDAGPGVEARARWTAKESVAKALGQGLRAGLRTVTTEPLPGGAGWAVAHWRGGPTGHLVRTHVVPGRALSLAVRAASPPAVRWTRWTVTRAGATADPAVVAVMADPAGMAGEGGGPGARSAGRSSRPAARTRAPVLPASPAGGRPGRGRTLPLGSGDEHARRGVARRGGP